MRHYVSRDYAVLVLAASTAVSRHCVLARCRCTATDAATPLTQIPVGAFSLSENEKPCGYRRSTSFNGGLEHSTLGANSCARRSGCDFLIVGGVVFPQTVGNPQKQRGFIDLSPE
jgi:hypothetical protein